VSLLTWPPPIAALTAGTATPAWHPSGVDRAVQLAPAGVVTDRRRPTRTFYFAMTTRCFATIVTQVRSPEGCDRRRRRHARSGFSLALRSRLGLTISASSRPLAT
jgi:hypothetical protein